MNLAQDILDLVRQGGPVTFERASMRIGGRLRPGVRIIHRGVRVTQAVIEDAPTMADPQLLRVTMQALRKEIARG